MLAILWEQISGTKQTGFKQVNIKLDLHITPHAQTTQHDSLLRTLCPLLSTFWKQRHIQDASCLNGGGGAVKTVMLLVLFKKFPIILQTSKTITKIHPCTYSNLLGFSHRTKWKRHSTGVVDKTHICTHTVSYACNEQTLHTMQTQNLFYSVPWT